MKLKSGEHQGLAPIDHYTLAYTALSSVLVLILSGRENWIMGLASLAVTAVVAFLSPSLRRAGKVGAFAGEFYPVFLTFVLYNEVGLSNRARGVSYDGVVQSWEQALFGGQPSLIWMSEWPDPLISTLFHLSYMSFYLIVLGTPLALWISGRRGAARETILMMMVTFYVCYTLFRIFPVAGPRFLLPLPDNPAVHTPVAAFAHKLVAGGSAWGTAFPSSHVAVALINAATAFRRWRKLGIIVLTLAVLLAFSTVYGQFHYAIDAVAGAAMAGAFIALTRIPGFRQQSTSE